MGKARNLFKKIRDTKGTLHDRMGISFPSPLPFAVFFPQLFVKPPQTTLHSFSLGWFGTLPSVQCY